MSGGHWNYDGHKLQWILEEMADDPAVRSRFPKLAARLMCLSSELFEIEHELDWDLSGDTIIKDDKEFEAKALGRLLEAVA